MLICMIQMFYLKSRHWEIKVIDINHITRRMFSLDSFWAAMHPAAQRLKKAFSLLQP